MQRTKDQVLQAFQAKFDAQSPPVQQQLLSAWRDAAKNPAAYMPTLKDFVDAAIQEAKVQAIGEGVEYVTGDLEIASDFETGADIVLGALGIL